MSTQQLQAAFDRTFSHYPEQLSNVKATITDDRIELSGTVASQNDKDQLHRLAEQNADGRKVVDDNLKIGSAQPQPGMPQADQPPTSKPPASDQKPMSEKPPVPPPSTKIPPR